MAPMLRLSAALFVVTLRGAPTAALRTTPTESDGLLPPQQAPLSQLPGLPTLEQYLEKEAEEVKELVMSRSGMPSSANSSTNASTAANASNSAEFRENFKAFLAGARLRKNEDVYVTIGDGAYSRYFPHWSSRLRHLGLWQQVIVCLDEEARSVATSHNLVAIDRHGQAVWKHAKHGKDTQAGLPLGLSVLKFLVPKLLLEQGFHRVVFTEGDIYFFANPTAHYPAPSVSYASMDDGRWRTIGLTNIGFMVFSGKAMLEVIDDFLDLWDRQFATATRVAQDQRVFQGVLRRYPQGEDQLFLDNALFALGPNQVKAETLVAHFAFACAGCKRFLLDALYEHQPSPEAFAKETVKSAHGRFQKPHWAEC